jgi:hypothetical protein
MCRTPWFRVVVLAVSGVATVGCIEENLAVLRNETDTPIRIAYAIPFFAVDVGAPLICPLLELPPMVRPNTDDPRSPEGWIPVAGLTVDAEQCEARFVLEPRVAALMYRNGYCDDYRLHADQGAAFRPTLERLVIESGASTREWVQWNAVEQFQRDPTGSCFLSIRESR